MMGILESPTHSASPQVPNPTPGLPHGLPPLPQVLPQILLPVSTICFYILPKTCLGVGTSGVPTVHTHTSPLGQVTGKGLEVQWGCSKVWGYEYGT